mmetsp:Transcript_5681/g.16428  ORF Transcript_5681/g.16428 Transcript_5681/m.16428 type:complete len:114 (-) Transcript_5681:2419-2760(-)
MRARGSRRHTKTMSSMRNGGGRHRRRNRDGMFYSLSLNKGASEWSENVTSDRTYFPRLKENFRADSFSGGVGDERHACEGADDHVADLDSMWMVGFLHHGKTANDDLVSCQEG